MRSLIAIAALVACSGAWAQSMFDDYEQPEVDKLQYSVVCETELLRNPTRFDIYGGYILMQSSRTRRYEIKERRGLLLAGEVEDVSTVKQIIFVDPANSTITTKFTDPSDGEVYESVYICD